MKRRSISPLGRINSTWISRPGADYRPLIVLSIGSVLSAVFLRNSAAFAPAEYFSRALGFLLLLALLYLISRVLLMRDGRLILNAFAPSSFYSLFFGAYYALPFATILLDPQIAGVRYFQIGAAALIAFICFQVGCRLAGTKDLQPYMPLDSLQARALLLVCWLSAALLGAFYLWRIQNRNFYTHAKSYVVGTDAASSLFESFVLQLHLPVILLFGLIAASGTDVARKARTSLNVFVVLSFLLFVASSQFRLAVTILPLGWIASRMFRETALQWRSALRLAAMGTFALALIFTVRASNANSELADSSNQLTDLVSGIFRGDFADSRLVTEATMGSDSTTSRARAVAPLLFFNDVIEALDSPENSFGKGRTFVYESKEVVPRAVWKDKPTFLSTQIFIRQQLGMSSVDNSPHPLLQLYYEFGWAGIAVGFLCMGLLIQTIVKRLNTVFMFLLFAFVWSAFVQVEVGLFLNLLVVTRAAVLVYIAWRVVYFMLSVSRRYGSGSGLTAPLPWPRHFHRPGKEQQLPYGRRDGSSRTTK